MTRMRYVVILVIFTFFLIAGDAETFAQYPSVTAYQPVIPATVSYVPMRRGLFGLRTVYRPMITPLPSSTTSLNAPATTQPIVAARPVIEPFPIVVQNSAPIPKVSSYYTPMQPTRVASPAPMPETMQSPIYAFPMLPTAPVVGY